MIVTDAFMVTDTDECSLGTDQCAQNCHNNVGSYTCSCKTGFNLYSDGRHCDGNYIIAISLGNIISYLIFRY